MEELLLSKQTWTGEGDGGHGHFSPTCYGAARSGGHDSFLRRWAAVSPLLMRAALRRDDAAQIFKFPRV